MADSVVKLKSTATAFSKRSLPKVKSKVCNEVLNASKWKTC